MSDRELLKQARRCIDPGAMPSPEYMSFCECTLKQIDARLSQPDWIRVEDALPVVPDGAEFVRVWEWEECCSSPWLSEFHPDYFMSASHWRYAETTPTPPEIVK